MAKNNKVLMWLGVIALVLLVGSMVGIVDLSKLSIAGDGTKPSPTPTNTPQQFGPCESATSNSITFAVQDAYGNVVTTDYNLWYSVNGAEQAQGASGTAITVSPYDVIAYRMVDKDTTHDVYGFVGTLTAECKTQQKVELKQGMQDTALSTTVYDTSAGADTTNAAASDATVGAGGTAKGKIFVAATTNDGVWSTSDGGRQIGVAIDYNSLVYKQPEITSVSDGTFSKLDATPNGHAVSSPATSTVFYVINSDALKDLGDITIRFQAEALTGTTNPTVTDGNISFTIYDAEMYQRTDRSWSTGFRNADTTADLGETNATDMFHVA